MRFFVVLISLMLVSPLATAFVVETKGGSAGVVYRVNTLSPTGVGSLERCVSASGPRVCVFETSGTISLGYHLYIRNPNLTIAGQTAPYPGITIKNGGIYVAASDVIIQHITITRGDEITTEGAALAIWGSQNNPTGLTERVIIDHCSFYWGTDETVTIWSEVVRDVVISNSIIGETLLPHATGMIVGAGAQNVAIVNNLFVSNTHRNPAFGNNTRVFIGGNLIYNHVDRAVQTEPESEATPATATVVDNQIIFGPDTVGTEYALWLKADTRRFSAVFMEGNAHPLKQDQWQLVQNDSGHDIKTFEPPLWYDDYRKIETSSLEGYMQEHVGANPRGRHSLDLRILQELASRSGGVKDCVSPGPGCTKDAGGWPLVPTNIESVQLPDDMYQDLNGNGENELYDWVQQTASVRS